MRLELANQLQSLNIERQDLTRAAQDEVRERLEAENMQAPLDFCFRELSERVLSGW